MRLLQLLGLLAYLAAAVLGSNLDLYDEIQLLYNLGQMQKTLPLPDYYADEETQYPEAKLADDWDLYPDEAALAGDSSPKDTRDYGEAALRDQEYMKQLPISGYQFISGGTGRQEEPSEVKTDKVLPAYCTPPNPCPVGYTGPDTCVKVFENTPDSNRRILEEEDCACDAEHMLSCPPGKQTIDPKSGFVNPSAGAAASANNAGDLDSDLDSTLGSLAENIDNMPSNPYLTTSSKRMKLVAKKGGRYITKRDTQERFDNLEDLFKNPYLLGVPKQVVSKKQAPRFDQFN